ncbi:hypothetical protein F8388_022584 [Cannabis sativa]|uniref:PGG domain-containing protein n=1 Tax=Cannabis sativa TaxID=3483 RepID=A0A7J6FZ94_CANSA|nr:hypothetical protein F8388_022584 [Cannabis sativa]
MSRERTSEQRMKIYNERGHPCWILLRSLKDLVGPPFKRSWKLITKLIQNIISLMKPILNPKAQMFFNEWSFQAIICFGHEVKKIVQPSYEKAKNKKGKNPEELFCLEHKRLLREGETWMKHTAQSCMLVATLIATVVFAAAFSLPGGNNDKGSPNDLAKTSFLIFVLSDGIALLNSIVAMVMFLSILISRYTEYDFLKRLPLKLIIGLTSLFFSMIAMMVAFSFAFVLAYDHGIKWVPLLISMLAIVPIALFAVLKFPLVLDTFNSTYCSGTLFRPRHMESFINKPGTTSTAVKINHTSKQYFSFPVTPDEAYAYSSSPRVYSNITIDTDATSRGPNPLLQVLRLQGQILSLLLPVTRVWLGFENPFQQLNPIHDREFVPMSVSVLPNGPHYFNGIFKLTLIKASSGMDVYFSSNAIATFNNILSIRSIRPSQSVLNVQIYRDSLDPRDVLLMKFTSLYML